jgi:hypothetical protein
MFIFSPGRFSPSSPSKNPFSMPPDHKLFVAINQERVNKKEKREAMKQMSVIEKTEVKKRTPLREVVGEPGRSLKPSLTDSTHSRSFEDGDEEVISSGFFYYL